MQEKPSFRQYSGPLSPAQAAEGIRAAVQNANALLSDAELLLTNERWQRAAALAILAIEEAHKPSLLRALLLARDESELRREWQAYRCHTKKNVGWILPQLVAQGARRLEDLRPMFDEGSGHGPALEILKQLALYTDACGRCNWSIPENVVESDLARSLVSIARTLVFPEPGAMTTEAELEIWVKHMGPVWKGAMGAMKRALMACCEEAEALGLLQGRHSPGDMAEFIE